ncbi:hypothetical protein glysoja_017922 [Glycine soja]|nr:hypothetical protein glysoja_017922 [Glycine soja]
MSSSFTSLHITALDAIVNVNSLFHPRRLHRPNLEPQRPFQQPQHRSGVVNRTALRAGMLVSVAGCGFLMLALVNVAQIKLETLVCGSSHTYAAVIPLLIFVPLALLIYFSFVLYAFTR